MKTFEEAHNALAAAHYYLNAARGEFCKEIEGPDASPPGQPWTSAESRAFDKLSDAEQVAIDAADDLLAVLGGDVCEDCARELAAPVVAPESN